jgi:subtilisin family serine protease
MKVTCVLLLSGLASSLAGVAPNAKISGSVVETLKQNDTMDIFVVLPKAPGAAVDSPAFKSLEGQGLTRAQRRQGVKNILSDVHRVAQKNVLAALRSAKGITDDAVHPFWITNQIFVRNASPEVVEMLANLPDVELITPNEVKASITPVEEKKPADISTSDNLEWSLDLIDIPSAWAVTKGEGVVVANIDSGVRYTHEALVDSYRGNVNGTFSHDYNWYDPLEFENDDFWCPGPPDCNINGKYPWDGFSHGTHTMGTMVGSETTGIGVAPGAKWIAAKGCRDGGSCLNFGLLSSAEFVMCPWKINSPSTGDCSQGADIVNNSWGGSGGDMFYVDATAAWKASGMFAFFAAGNSGPRCGTVGSPGDYADVISVGASDNQDRLASFSSRGPGRARRMAPDIVAPGDDIRSGVSGMMGTSYDVDNRYSVYSGTSMATPHVAGLAALILSANPSVDFDGMLQILQGTTAKGMGEPNNGVSGQNVCDGVGFSDVPSYHYGYGRINAADAVGAASK